VQVGCEAGLRSGAGSACRARRVRSSARADKAREKRLEVECTEALEVGGRRIAFAMQRFDLARGTARAKCSS